MDNKSKSILLFLAEASDKQASSFLKVADRGQIFILKETTLNLLLGNIPLTEDEKAKLKRYKNFLREFSQKGSKLDLSRKAKAINLITKLAIPTLKGL